MADEKENPASAPGQMPRVRRRAPTIDLKATEVAVEPPPAAAAAAETPEPPITPPHYSTEPPAYERSASPPPEEPAAARQAPPPKPPEEKPRVAVPVLPAAIAALAGGLGALLICVLLWLAGFFAGTESPADPRLASIEAQLREIAARPAPRNPDNRATDELNARLTQLETARSNTASGAALSEDAIKQLQATVAELARRTDESAAAARDARGQADAARTAEKSSVDAMADRVAGIESTTRKLSDDVAKSLTAAGADKALRAAVAAQALRAAVERGDAYAAELAAAKALSPDAQALAPLEVFAASGLPSNATLSRELSVLTPATLKPAETPTGGFLDRLQANAEKLVRIRRVDEASGDDTSAVFSRAQARAERGDFSGAVAELNKLPPEARAPANEWIKKTEARNAALGASRRLVADALTALGKAAP